MENKYTTFSMIWSTSKKLDPNKVKIDDKSYKDILVY